MKYQCNEIALNKNSIYTFKVYQSNVHNKTIFKYSYTYNGVVTLEKLGILLDSLFIYS